MSDPMQPIRDLMDGIPKGPTARDEFKGPSRPRYRPDPGVMEVCDGCREPRPAPTVWNVNVGGTSFRSLCAACRRSS